jgi:hypothetical protein
MSEIVLPGVLLIAGTKKTLTLNSAGTVSPGDAG